MRISSPDGRYTVEFYDLEALATAGAVVGSLRVLPRKWRFYPRRFMEQTLWSDDGRYVALPELCPAADMDPENRTWLMVTTLDVQENKEATHLELYNDISFISFENGVLVTEAERASEETRLVLNMREQTWHPFPHSSLLEPSFATSWADDSWTTILLWPDLVLALPRVFERLTEPIDRLLRWSSPAGDGEHRSQ